MTAQGTHHRYQAIVWPRGVGGEELEVRYTEDGVRVEIGWVFAGPEDRVWARIGVDLEHSSASAC